MAAVIRAARIDPERMVLAVRAQPARGATTAAAKTPAPPAAQSATSSAALAAKASPAALAPVPPSIPPSWIEPATSAGSQDALERTAAEFDRELLERELRARLETERREVLDAAQAEGHRRGLEKAQGEYAAQIAALAALLGSARDALSAEIAGTEDIIVEIAFESVCKILGDALASREGVVAAVREVLGAVRERERLLVRVSPSDLTILEENRAQLALGEDGAALDLIADERVALGGCLVETTGGTLDGRLETQMQRLVETLASARRMLHGESHS